MNKKKVARRSKIKPFVKLVNYNHLMPTRYSVDLGIDKAVVTKQSLKDNTKKVAARKEIKSKLESKYKAGEFKWFFSKLRF
eukprot:CAMPEP_0170560430 /NCGR_PEP_ID=MMETSP0211-20121228/48847_1 /TAXON_ID=311385 /ORGANISM="Pseudokeronopsis sp., Strain OXSARD2" /LENGTH=80 /DNA_ID=CAMNT_0010874599 /DNA_START=78 /DNA_END=320 /DNA_ORIENTATION=+